MKDKKMYTNLIEYEEYIKQQEKEREKLPPLQNEITNGVSIDLED